MLVLEDVTRVFGGGRALFGGRPKVHALRGVSLAVSKGESAGIVGESGCGKTTMGRIIAGLDKPNSGRALFGGRDIAAMHWQERARKIQYVFQSPLSALNPRQTIGEVLHAPMRHLLAMDKAARTARAEELMAAVGLPPAFLPRYPHEFSGGQAQRIGIARALAAKPELIVLDEPVSALDVSVQGQVLNLLAGLKRQFQLTYLFISHDLAVVESVSDKVAVMYSGRIAELAKAGDIFARPRHPYTRLLLDSAPTMAKPPQTKQTKGGGASAEEGGALWEKDSGETPDPCAPPKGCAFFARCPRASEKCQIAMPQLTPAPNGKSHLAACHRPHDHNDNGGGG